MTAVAGPASQPGEPPRPTGSPPGDDEPGRQRPGDDAARRDETETEPHLPTTPNSVGSASRIRDGNPRTEREVAAMFDEIAPVYDRLNTIMTLGLDRRWRAAAVAASAVKPGDAVIDVAAGTGKLAAALADRVGPFGHVAAVDLSAGMVAHGRVATSDLVQLEFVLGNALDLPFADGRFDAATIAFGLRNLSDFAAGFGEMRRVVRPGGRVVCLELTMPRPRWWGRIHHETFRRLAPLVGSMAGRRRTYRYLPASLDAFPDADQLAGIMVTAGLVDVTIRRLGLGAVAIHTGRVPGG